MSASTAQPNVSEAWKVWVGSIVSVVLATIAVAARLAARRISAAKFWWDDFTIVLALVRYADSSRTSDIRVRNN